jgi:hypothetical protein
MANQFRIASRPIVYQANVAPTTTADSLSSAFSSQTRYVRLGVANGGAGTAYVLATFGSGTPATGTSASILPAGYAEVFAVSAGEKVAVQSRGSALTVSITEVE